MPKRISLGEACESLLEALNALSHGQWAGRGIDCVRGASSSCLEIFQKMQVLANQCCQAGSLLHKAAEMGQKDAVRALLLARAVHLGPTLYSVILSSASPLSNTAFTMPSTTTVYLCANSLPPGPFPLLSSSVGLVECGFKGIKGCQYGENIPICKN